MSTDFADEDDYYNAHFGSPAGDPQDDDYCQEEEVFDHCYVGIAEVTGESLTASASPLGQPIHSAFLSAGVESPSSMARIHKMPITPVPDLIEH